MNQDTGLGSGSWFPPSARGWTQFLEDEEETIDVNPTSLGPQPVWELSDILVQIRMEIHQESHPSLSTP